MRRRRHPTAPARAAPARTTAETQTHSVLFGDEANVQTFFFPLPFQLFCADPAFGAAGRTRTNDFLSTIIFGFLCELVVTWVVLPGQNCVVIYLAIPIL